MYRSIDTEVWNDGWFQEELNRDQKLLFLFLITNQRTTTTGAFEITLSSLSTETGIPRDELSGLLASLSPKIVWWPEHRIVWVRNFHRRQFPNANEKIITNARSVLARMPAEVVDTVCTEYPQLTDPTASQAISPAYPIEDVSIPPSIEEKSIDTDTASERETGTEDDSRVARVVAADTPFAVYAGFLDEIGTAEDTVAPAWKKKQLGIAKSLIEQGYGDDAVRRCTRYMRSQTWRTSPFDLGGVSGYIGTWEANGSPERDQPRGSPRLTPDEQRRQHNKTVLLEHYDARKAASHD